MSKCFFVVVFFTKNAIGYKCYETFNSVRNTEIRNSLLKEYRPTEKPHNLHLEGAE